MAVQECVRKKKKQIHYIKIHVPWETLSAYAELLLLRAPIQVCLSVGLSVCPYACVYTPYSRHQCANVIKTFDASSSSSSSSSCSMITVDRYMYITDNDLKHETRLSKPRIEV